MDAEVVVVGAGAAGLAAARALADARRRAIVLEARGRVGGRVWTDYTFGPVPVERGAEFIHGEQADTWAWVRRAGAHTFAAARWAGRRIVLEDGRLVGPAVFEQRADLQPVFRLEEDIAAYDGPDISLGEWLRAHEFGALAAHIADVRLAHANCATPETISVAELAYELRFSDKGPGDFRILEGYDFVFAALAAGLDIRLNMPVSRVRWGVEGVEVQAGTGADARTFRARHAVITLPPSPRSAENPTSLPPPGGTAHAVTVDANPVGPPRWTSQCGLSGRPGTASPTSAARAVIARSVQPSASTSSSDHASPSTSASAPSTTVIRGPSGAGGSVHSTGCAANPSPVLRYTSQRGAKSGPSGSTSPSPNPPIPVTIRSGRASPSRSRSAHPWSCRSSGAAATSTSPRAR